KMCVIKKRAFNETKQYAFLSTGNFNENTAAYYGDHCLMTTNKNIIADVNKIFSYLENPAKYGNNLPACKMLPVSPTNMRAQMKALIESEIKVALKKKPSSIKLKLNSLVDAELINALYEAAKEGVDVKMVIRGICCAYTKQKSFKKNIYALSIIDDYLEHARVFIFGNGGNPNIYISSADWMIRNLDHRIEVACPIYNAEIKEELLKIMEIQLAENVKGRLLDNDQDNEYIEPKEDEAAVRSQVAIYNYLKNKTYSL
ncbi:MAG: polyphosphate kinase 1, partial [Chitinophagia bacterium]|nr:polyphosphate kinase 1 [Chitinophagia bacterium]